MQPRLCWPLRRLAVAAAVLSAVTAAGCSLPLDTMFENSATEAEQTGSVAPSDRLGQAATPSEADLAYARAVATDALAHGSKDNSIPWENPHSGAGGNITPLAASYSEGVLFCRDFLASYVHGQTQAWLRGEACRSEHGTWEVKSLKQLKQG